MATQCNPQMRFGAQRDFAIGGAGTVQLNLTANDRTGPVLKTGTTPPVTEVCSLVITLSGGAFTLDLEAIDYEDETLDLGGLKLQFLRIKNPSANTITISEGSSNGYAIAGGTNIVVPAGADLSLLYNDTNPDVAAADSELDFAGTGTDTLILEIAAG